MLVGHAANKNAEIGANHRLEKRNDRDAQADTPLAAASDKSATGKRSDDFMRGLVYRMHYARASRAARDQNVDMFIRGFSKLKEDKA